MRRLFRRGDFVDNGLSGSARIFRSQYRSSHNDVIRTRFNGFRWSRDARLVIVFCGCPIFRFGPHTWCHDQEFAPAGFANRSRFLHGGYDAVHTNLFCKPRQLHDSALRRSANSNFLHGFLVHARKNRHSKQTRPVSPHRHSSADGLDRRFKHALATQRMHVYKLYAGHGRGGKHRSSNCIRNVVEFQVEKNTRSQRRNFFHCSGSRRRKQLIPDLKHPDKIGNLFCEFQGRG